MIPRMHVTMTYMRMPVIINYQTEIMIDRVW